MKSKLLTIYLPQFHEIPENNEWWGEGFTEWKNVKRGKPFYPGHYQPRVPLHDNYYDLSNLKVLEKHALLAQKAGIGGFAFYHYYFDGRTLLEKPIEEYRDKSKVQMPYCLIWANQSWTRTWYRAENERTVLLQQVYGGPESWKRHFQYLLKFFEDDRYIKIDEKPVYIIYLPQDIKCRREMFKLWNELARENGFKGIYLIAMNTGWGYDNRTSLYNAYMNFEPIHTITTDSSIRKDIQGTKRKYSGRMNITKTSIKNWLFAQNVYTYTFVSKQIEKAKKDKKKVFLGTFSGWDNTPRKDEDGFIVTGSSPRKFRKHLMKMLLLSEKMDNEYLFLNAWNEWSEGAYIEPDKKYGYAYLKTIKDVVERYEDVK